MFEIIRLFWDICLLRKGPQDCPYSFFLLQLAIVLNILVNFLLLHLSTGWVETLQQIAVEITMTLGFAYAVLWFFKKTGRFYQTATALLGSDIVISFIGLPIFSTFSTDRPFPFANVLILLLMIWYWLVIGHILRHALDKHWSIGLSFSLLYIYSASAFINMLFA